MDCFYAKNKKPRIHHDRKGKIYGFPVTGKCSIQRDCKLKPINKYWKTHKDDVQYIGIAIDEPKRLERIANTKHKISLLEKYNYTEEMAKQKCIQYGLLSPIYDFTNRGGCWFCPNAKCKELRNLFDNHRILWDILLDLEDEPDKIAEIFNVITKTSIHDKDEQFRLEDAQMTIFDYI